MLWCTGMKRRNWDNQMTNKVESGLPAYGKNISEMVGLNVVATLAVALHSPSPYRDTFKRDKNKILNQQADQDHHR
jgi:hypothetical protein